MNYVQMQTILLTGSCRFLMCPLERQKPNQTTHLNGVKLGYCLNVLCTNLRVCFIFVCLIIFTLSWINGVSGKKLCGGINRLVTLVRFSTMCSMKQKGFSLEIFLK